MNTAAAAPKRFEDFHTRFATVAPGTTAQSVIAPSSANNPIIHRHANNVRLAGCLTTAAPPDGNNAYYRRDSTLGGTTVSLGTTTKTGWDLSVWATSSPSYLGGYWTSSAVKKRVGYVIGVPRRWMSRIDPSNALRTMLQGEFHMIDGARLPAMVAPKLFAEILQPSYRTSILMQLSQQIPMTCTASARVVEDIFFGGTADYDPFNSGLKRFQYGVLINRLGCIGNGDLLVDYDGHNGYSVAASVPFLTVGTRDGISSGSGGLADDVVGRFTREFSPSAAAAATAFVANGSESSARSEKSAAAEVRFVGKLNPHKQNFVLGVNGFCGLSTSFYGEVKWTGQKQYLQPQQPLTAQFSIWTGMFKNCRFGVQVSPSFDGNSPSTVGFGFALDA